ncbi:hypothetical protein KNT64_gp048 [Pseudomonas phage PspYZU05]|uniref:Uncharacterized protein n=1 Tax=Pseudomonas phage PspYZU05 TaxID=1983556 RepID=A0A2U7N2E2_9CAUD|nr:hypothetical protein KNT64_gp048 [Pseudomonas phage PspYZU05]ASD52000.1 hypothetical protein PspYZU05_48 [Pseudomonas phage PspYZU05]
MAIFDGNGLIEEMLAEMKADRIDKSITNFQSPGGNMSIDSDGGFKRNTRVHVMTAEEVKVKIKLKMGDVPMTVFVHNQRRSFTIAKGSSHIGFFSHNLREKIEDKSFIIPKRNLREYNICKEILSVTLWTGEEFTIETHCCPEILTLLESIFAKSGIIE